MLRPLYAHAVTNAKERSEESRQRFAERAAAVQPRLSFIINMKLPVHILFRSVESNL